MKVTVGTFWKWLLKKLRTIFIAGLVVIVPIGITAWILIWMFNGVEGLLAPVVKLIFGRPVPGVGFGITIVLIFIVGIIATNVVGHRIIRWGESVLGRIPIARHFYVAFREVFRGFSEENAGRFLSVVLVEFPTRGMWTVGFITNEDVDKDGRPVISVFIPLAPNPTSGFIEILREEEIIRTKIPIEDAMKMVISGGRMSPGGLGDTVKVSELRGKFNSDRKL